MWRVSHFATRRQMRHSRGWVWTLRIVVYLSLASGDHRLGEGTVLTPTTFHHRGHRGHRVRSEIGAAAFHSITPRYSCKFSLLSVLFVVRAIGGCAMGSTRIRSRRR